MNCGLSPGSRDGAGSKKEATSPEADGGVETWSLLRFNKHDIEENWDSVSEEEGWCGK